MLSVFVCEDKDEQRETITKCISNYILMEGLNMKVVCSTPSPEGVIEYLHNNKNKVAGLYFLDIDLECEMNGIQLASAIRKHDPRGFIVFITADALSHLLTFKYKIEAMDYIVKGDINLKERICECIRNAYDRYALKSSSQLHNNFVINVSKNSTVAIDISKICYLEKSAGLSHMITIYTEDEMYRFRGSLSKIVKDLGEPFYKCHRAFIVNITKISDIDFDKLKLTIKNGAYIDVAYKRVNEVKSLMEKFSMKAM